MTAHTHRLTTDILQDEAQLRALIGEPLPLTCAKITDRLNAATRRYVERSPLVCLATSDAEGRCDVSPRGDPAGFVRILDERTLLMPERPGNRIADSLRNILANPRVGLIFIVPGATETFRVNGRAVLTTDAALLAPSTLEGKAPRLGLLIDIEEAYTQCSKAFLRAGLPANALTLLPEAVLPRLLAASQLAGVALASSDPVPAHELALALANRPGAILPLVTAAGHVRQLYRFTAEQTLTVNTAAAGGNAALLAGVH